MNQNLSYLEKLFMSRDLYEQSHTIVSKDKDVNRNDEVEDKINKVLY